MAQSAGSETTMRAVVQDTYGCAEVLHVAQLPRPTIGKGDVLVQVRAAGLDRGTWHLMTGKPYAVRLALGLRRPRNPISGRDVAGTVAAVGSSVTEFSVGDEVFGIAPGSFADYTVAKPAKLALKPAQLSFVQAAVIPISGLTALQALTDVGRLEAGQKVLVLGASGGVGSYAVQLAKALGAEVTGVCSSAKLDFVRSLGVDHVIDYTREDVVDGDDRYDLILDIAGGRTLSQLRGLLTETGTLVLVGNENGDRLTGGMGRLLRAALISLVGRQRLTGFISKERGSDIERLAEFLEAGTLRPTVDQCYPLDDVPAAMRLLESGQVRGKLAVTL